MFYESDPKLKSISIREASDITGMSKQYFYKLIRERSILFYKFGSSVRIPLEVVDALRKQIKPKQED